jgi:hypothetical protein
VPRLPGVVVALFASVACSSLPEFAAPTRSAVDSTDAAEPGDAIRYRALTRADFKAQNPPGKIKHGEYELGAQTCGVLLNSPENRSVLTKTTEPNGKVHCTGRFKVLRFRALMDRSCSWWNPNNQKPEYTLQHEQIHFALHEIAARRLNQRARELVNTTEINSDDCDEVAAKLTAITSDLLDSEAQDALERNEDFDSETSLGHDAKRQAKWWNTVQRELAELEAYK